MTNSSTNSEKGVGEISIGVGGVSSVVASVMGASGASGVVSSSDGRVEKIIIERFCLLGEKSIEGVDGGQ